MKMTKASKTGTLSRKRGPLSDGPGKSLAKASSNARGGEKPGKKTEKKSQEYSESIINTVREPLIVLDQDLRVVSVSRSFYDVFKVKPEETVGQLIYDLGNKQWDIPRLRELLEDILPKKATFDDYEVEYDFPGIGRRVMLLNARRIPRPPEKPKVILLAIEDVTRRKKVEESYLRLAAIVNTSLDGIIGKTLRGDIVSWNKGAEKIYGYTEKEMQGQNISLLAPPGYKEEILDQLKKMRAGELIKNYETKRVRKDGVVLDISLTLSPIKDKSGNIYGVSAIMHDITEQKEANQILLVNEYSESIIDTVREPLIVLDQDLRVVLVNRSFYDVFKVKPEETVGQLIFNLGNKQWDIPRLRELLETILPQKATFDNYEVEHDFSTIGRRVMLLNARQIQRVLGKERIILLAIEDITERKEIEAGLEKTRKELEVIKQSADESSEFAESIINTVREPLISLDQDLRVVTVSRSFYEVFKVKPEETVGQLIYDLGNKQWDIPRLRELLETILPQKTTFDNYEVEHDFSTIGRRVMLLNARQIQRVLGKERIILLAIDDVTDRRKLEEAHGKLAAIVESADDAIIGEDLDGAIVSWNNGAEIAYGYNAGEIVGKSVSLLMPPSHIDEYKEVLTKIARGETIKHYETQRRRKDGQIIDVSMSVSPVKDSSGKIISASTIARDITERREIEKGLEKAHEELKELAAELERTARVKSEFLANMSHELRTPLNSINGFSEVLYDETFGPLNVKQRQYVNNVLTSGKHLLLLINQILDMAKVEAGKMKLALSVLPMKSLLNELSMLVADMVSKKKLQMLLEIAEDLPDIKADELKVKEIIYNLLSNAVKFTPEGGKIGMRARKAGSGIEIVVWDTGVGIAPENMGKIFEGFFRVDTPYSRVTEGTGLGLPLSKKLVELHGGKFSVESGGLNKGTEVRFTLPIVSTKEV
jgi:PAS domain S-box-containing protein